MTLHGDGLPRIAVSTFTMTTAHLLFALLSTGYILVALIFEERDLVNAHGEAYASNQREVLKLIPFLRRRARRKPGRNASVTMVAPEKKDASVCMAHLFHMMTFFILRHQ